MFVHNLTEKICGARKAAYAEVEKALAYAAAQRMLRAVFTSQEGCLCKQTHAAHPLQTCPQTGPITIHFAAKLSVQCKNVGLE